MASELRHRFVGDSDAPFNLRLMYPGSDPAVLQCQLDPDQKVHFFVVGRCMCTTWMYS